MTADRSRRFWTSWPQAAVPLGNLLATVVLLVTSLLLSDAAFLSWGWRIAFWLSAVVVLVGFYIRTRVSEAPIFLEAKAQAESEQRGGYGVGAVLRRYPTGVLQAMGIRFAENIVYFIVVSFSIEYLKTVHDCDTSQLLLALLTAHVIHFLVIPVFGRLSDRVGRKPLYLAGANLSAFWAFLAFPLFDMLDLALIVLAVAIGLVFHGLMYAPQPSVMAELFPTRMRYSGVSFGSQVTAILAGSLAPILAAQWLKQPVSWRPGAIYIAVACVITAVSVLTLRETRGVSLRAIDDKDAAPARESVAA